MWKQAGNGIDVYFDTEAGAVRISHKEPIIEGGKPIIRRELGVFRSKESWDNSPYRNKVTNPSMESEIELFWVDLRAKKAKQKTRRRVASFATMLAGMLSILAANYMLLLGMMTLGKVFAAIGIIFGFMGFYTWVRS